jgi:hypothetical protein
VTIGYYRDERSRAAEFDGVSPATLACASDGYIELRDRAISSPPGRMSSVI